jgi:type IV pilus assembly protein PilW
MYYSPKNNEQGFTMVELVVGLAISLILMGIAVKIFLVQQRAYNVQGQLSEMQQNIRAATDMIVRETKMAGYNPTGASFKGITYDTSQLRILKDDFDGDGFTTSANEDITYSYDGTDSQIVRNTGSGNYSVAENIEVFTFDYLNATGSSTTDTDAIRQIKITITGRTAKADPDLDRVDGPAAFGYRYGTLTTRVTPENLDF